MTKREAANAEMHVAYSKRYDDCTPREKKLRDCDAAWAQLHCEEIIKGQKRDSVSR